MKFSRLIISLTVILFLVAQISATMSLPCDFWGYGDLNIGDVISAYSDDVLCGAFTVTTNGEYGPLHCKIDDPETSEKEGVLNGDTIYFKINEQIIEDIEIICSSAASDQVDLSEGITEEQEENNETNNDNQTQEEIPSEQTNGGGGSSEEDNKNINPSTTGQIVSESYSEDEISVNEVSEDKGQQEEMNNDEEQASQNSITGAVIGVSKKTGKIIFYFFGILLIGFVLIKTFKFYQKRKTDLFRNYNPRSIRVTKYSDWIKQQQGEKNE